MRPKQAGSGDHVDRDWRYERIVGGNGWLRPDVPDHVSELLLDFSPV